MIVNLYPGHTKKKERKKETKETHKKFYPVICWLSDTEYGIKSCTQQHTLWI